MADQIAIRGFRVPEGLSPDGAVVRWLSTLSERALGAIDRGDSEDPENATDKADDRYLGRVELLQSLLHDARRATIAAAQSGVRKKWRAWKTQLTHLDAIAQRMRELGWEPIFHIGDLAYYRRAIAILQRAPDRPADPSALRDRLREQYWAARPSWGEGGLCLEPAHPEIKEDVELATDQVITACMAGDSWTSGTCTESSRKVAFFLTSALAVYAPALVDQLELIAMEHTAGDKGHIFIALRGKDGPPLAFDPYGLGFGHEHRYRYLSHDLWRGALAIYYFNLGLDLKEPQRFSEAEEAFRKAITLAPLSNSYHRNLGGALWGQRRWAEAELAFRRAVALDPGDTTALATMGEVLVQQGHFAEAEAVCRRAVALDPSFAFASMELAHALLKQGRLREAEVEQRRALALEPEEAQLHNMLGAILWEQRRWAETEQAFRTAIRLDPKYADARHNLGEFLREHGRGPHLQGPRQRRRPLEARHR